MDLSFNQVSYDGDLSEFDHDELVELVREFKNAQDSNLAEFKSAAERLEKVQATVSEFEEADATLTEEVAEATFLSKSEAEDLSFERKREVLTEARESADEADEESDGEFDSMGKQGETHDDDDAKFDSDVKDRLSNITGVVVDSE